MDLAASGGNQFPIIRGAPANVRRQLVDSLSKYLMSLYFVLYFAKYVMTIIIHYRNTGGQLVSNKTSFKKNNQIRSKGNMKVKTKQEKTCLDKKWRDKAPRTTEKTCKYKRTKGWEWQERTPGR